jgi:hypothetical protein
VPLVVACTRVPLSVVGVAVTMVMYSPAFTCGTVCDAVPAAVKFGTLDANAAGAGAVEVLLMNHRTPMDADAPRVLRLALWRSLEAFVIVARQNDPAFVTLIGPRGYHLARCVTEVAPCVTALREYPADTSPPHFFVRPNHLR